MSRPWLKIVARAAMVAAGLYLALLGVVWFNQRSLQYFPDARPQAPDADGPSIQVVHLDTRDGERLVAWYLPPQPGKPILLHFNGNGGGLAIQRGRWRRIADAGVGFFAVGYRGYAGSTGRPTEKGLHEDARAAYDWVAARFPASRIVIHGYSLGSGVAVPLAAQKPARALVLEAPFSSAVDLAAWRGGGWLPTGLLLRDRYMNTDWIDRVRIPVLIVHGDRDSVIPHRFGRRLFALANQPKRFVTMAGSDHNTLVRDGLYPHVWDFLGVKTDDSLASAEARP